MYFRNSVILVMQHHLKLNEKRDNSYNLRHFGTYRKDVLGTSQVFSKYYVGNSSVLCGKFRCLDGQGGFTVQFKPRFMLRDIAKNFLLS